MYEKKKKTPGLFKLTLCLIFKENKLTKTVPLQNIKVTKKTYFTKVAHQNFNNLIKV